MPVTVGPAGTVLEVDDSNNLKVTIYDADDTQIDFDAAAPTKGDVAHDAADSGEPVKIGLKALSPLSGVTRVASADRTDAYADLDGAMYVRNASIADVVSGNASNTDGTSTSLIAASGSASIAHALTMIIVHNAHATTNGYVEIKDGSTAKLTIPVPATGGAVITIPPPGLIGTANTAWNFDPSAAITTIYCSAVGYKVRVT